MCRSILQQRRRSPLHAGSQATIGQHDDIYQVLAYAVAADLPGGLLIYAAGEREPARHDIVHLGKRLEVIALDLAGSPETVLQQIDHVAGRIRQLHHHALALAPGSVR